MKEHFILFLVGKDRPGIVDDTASLLYDRGAKIEDSRMAVMGGCFSIMTLFTCSVEQLDDIKNGLESLRDLGLESSLYEVEEPAEEPLQAALPLNVEVTAMDHPYIVQKIVHILRDHNVNILSLNTQVTQAPLSGSPLFNLTLQAAIPADEQVSKVKDDLNALAEEINLDLNFGN
jgi:glycine cleavage system regulatory protein